MSETAPDSGTPTEGATETTTTAPDFSPVYDRVDQLAGDLSTLREDILGRLPEPEQPQAEDPWAALLGETEDPEPAPQLNIDALRQAFRSELEQELSVRDAEIAHLRTTHDLQSLLEQHPDLKDPEVRKATGEAARATAEQISQQYGPEFAAALTNNPGFIALVHQAQAGQRAAAAEVAATGDPTQLEGGGGAAPGQTEQPNIVQRVMQQRRQVPKGFL